MSDVFEDLLEAAKEYRDNSDAHIGSTGRPLDDAIEAAERETESVAAELTRLREFEEKMRSIAIDNAGTYPAIVYDALEDLDRKRE